MSGIWCPFILPLASPDKRTVPRVMQDYFLRFFGPTLQACFSVMENIRSAWGIVETTDAGHVLAHLCKCVDIGLLAQARIYPIIHDTVYEGCVLIGSGFTISHSMTLFRPQPYDTLLLTMQQTNPRHHIIHEISKIAGEDISQFKSMRALRGKLMTCVLTEDGKFQIEKLAAKLAPPIPYWAVGASLILSAIALIQDTANISDDVPMHPSALFTTDRVMSVLSAFGFNAFSFMIPTAPRFKLAGGGLPKVKDFSLVFRIVTLRAAVADFHTMANTHEITNNPKTLSTVYQDRKIDGTDKIKVWDALIKLGATKQATKTSTSSEALEQIQNYDIEL